MLQTPPGSLLESLPRPSLLAQGVWDYSLENTATDCRGNCWEKSKRERGPLWEAILILSGSGEESICHGEVSPTRINKEQRDLVCERAEGRWQGISLLQDTGEAFEEADCEGEQLNQGAVKERWPLGTSLWEIMKPQGRAEHQEVEDLWSLVWEAAHTYPPSLVTANTSSSAVAYKCLRSAG